MTKHNSETTNNDSSFVFFNNSEGSSKLQAVEVKNVTTLSATNNAAVHFFAGGISGAVAATLTCPLDVIKTRQQSSLNNSVIKSRNQCLKSQNRLNSYQFVQKGKVHTFQPINLSARSTFDLFSYRLRLSGSSSMLHLRSILKLEGTRALFKGLGPTLVGFVPSKAIQFLVYESSKTIYSQNCYINPNSSLLHMVSSMTAGLCCTTAVCPIFVVKTKQQLHRRTNKTALTALECCKDIMKTNGMRGFYRGLAASYAGIIESVLYLTMYEKFKIYYANANVTNDEFTKQMKRTWKDFACLMLFASVGKSVACVVAYPHEVVRTRLREETCQKRYRGFFQTLHTVAKQEGVRALYRGLPIQVLRQVPNMAIFMGTYEFIKYMAGSH